MHKNLYLLFKIRYLRKNIHSIMTLTSVRQEMRQLDMLMRYSIMNGQQVQLYCATMEEIIMEIITLLELLQE